jgi:hypothetical protein
MNTHYHKEDRTLKTLKTNCNYECLECPIFKEIKEASVEIELKGQDSVILFEKYGGTECYSFFASWINWELGH